MDNGKFDVLARRLSVEQSRRSALRATGVGLVAGLVPGLFLAGGSDAADLSSETCSPLGTRCGRRKRKGKGPKARRRQQPACNKCCSKHSIRQQNGQRRCSCIPDLSFKLCRRDDQCCSGVCRKIEDLCDPNDPDPNGCEAPEDFPFPPGAKICLPGIINVVV